MHFVRHCRKTMENVRVPWQYTRRRRKRFSSRWTNSKMRIYAAAGAIPATDRAIQETIAYTSQRRAFGKSILDQPVCALSTCRVQTERWSVSGLYYQCTTTCCRRRHHPQATMLKLKSGRLVLGSNRLMSQFWADQATQTTLSSPDCGDTRLISIGVALTRSCSMSLMYMGIDPGSRVEHQSCSQNLYWLWCHPPADFVFDLRCCLYAQLISSSTPRHRLHLILSLWMRNSNC